MPNISNEELKNGVSLADSKRDFLSITQAQRNSDFVNKDKPPYGVLAGLGIVGGAAAIVVADTVLKDSAKKSTMGLGIAFLVLGVGAGVIAVISEREDNKIKRAVSDTTEEALRGQTENDISISDAYTAALMATAEDQISKLSDLGVASSKIDLNNKLSRIAQSTGATAKALSDDDLSTGISNLNTLNTNSANLIAGYI